VKTLQRKTRLKKVNWRGCVTQPSTGQTSQHGHSMMEGERETVATGFGEKKGVRTEKEGKRQRKKCCNVRRGTEKSQAKKGKLG